MEIIFIIIGIILVMTLVLAVLNGDISNNNNNADGECKISDNDEVIMKVYDVFGNGEFYQCKFKSVNGIMWTDFKYYSEMRNEVTSEFYKYPEAFNQFRKYKTLKECKEYNDYFYKLKEKRDKEISDNLCKIL